MRALTPLVAVAALCLLFTYTSCTGSGGGFKTHQDSMQFAKAYYDRYPDENSVRTLYSNDTLPMKSLMPISWAEASKYAATYDKKPIIYSPTGVPLNGYFIDSAGYSLVKSNKEIKGLFLRFGRRDDGVFTIMLLGTNGKNELIKDSTVKGGYGGNNGDANFDNSPSCPNFCPAD